MNDIAYLVDEKRITFTQFSEDINRARISIKKTHAKRIMLFDMDCYRFSVFLFALILENREVILPPNSQTGTIENLSITCDGTLGSITLENKPKIVVDFKIMIDFEPISRQQLFERFTGYLVFYTSGSSGQHKPIRKNCTQLTNELDMLTRTFANSLESSDLLVSTVSHQHIYGLLFKILLPLKNELSIVATAFEYPEHISTFLSGLTNDKKVMVVSSPAHLKRWINDNVLIPFKRLFSGLFSSGGPLLKEISDRLNDQLNLFPVEVLGSTETGGIAWRQDQSINNGSWRIFSMIRFSASGSGRLVITSPFMTESHYKTDDLIKVIDNDTFQLLGRADRTIKLEEKRVNLADIEKCLLAHSWVCDARVLLIDNKGHVQRKVLGAVIELSPEAKALLELNGKRFFNEQFKNHLLNQFERIILPKKWRYLDDLPYNPQGKLILTALEALFV